MKSIYSLFIICFCMFSCNKSLLVNSDFKTMGVSMQEQARIDSINWWNIPTPNITFNDNGTAKISPDFLNVFQDSLFKYSFRKEKLILKSNGIKHEFEYNYIYDDSLEYIVLNINDKYVKQIDFISYTHDIK